MLLGSGLILPCQYSEGAMKKPIQFPLQQGHSSHQAHCDLPAGCFEREIGREGFFGPVSHMYHSHRPTDWIDFQGPLRPHAFDLNELGSAATLPWRGAALLQNAQVSMWFWSLQQSMSQLARNADGDTLLFVHSGSGDLYCDYGHMPFGDGDYLLLPRGCCWRLELQNQCQFLVLEACGSSLQLPDKGMLGPTAVFDAAALVTPQINEQFLEQQDEQPWQIVIKRQQQESVLSYPFNPLDTVGWHGTNTAIKINWRDLRPVMSHRYHLPPSAHTTFVGDGFVVCTFCPRPVETDAGAIKVPFFHSNDDFDEVLFYHRGNFFSRDNIDAGFMTFHPSGFPHGPHPKALQNSQTNPPTFLDEVAVMVDTRQPLNILAAAESVENSDYVNSWRHDGQQGETK